MSFLYEDWPPDTTVQIQTSALVSYSYGQPPASAIYSTVTVSPASLPADGTTPATVTATLTDFSGNPVVSKFIRIIALETLPSGLVTSPSSVIQPRGPTDSNGQVIATITSTIPGTAIISVLDITDGIELAQTPKITFTANLVAPSADFQLAIQTSLTTAQNLLFQGNSTVAKIAMDEGSQGDYFRNQISAETAQALVDTAFFGAGEALGAAIDQVVELTVLQKVMIGVFETAINNLSDARLAMHANAQNKTGLSAIGQGIATTSQQQQSALIAQAQGLYAGVPAISASRSSDWQTAMALRDRASQVLLQALVRQDATLQSLRSSQENGADTFVEILGYGAAIAAAFLAPPASLIVRLATLDAGLLNKYSAQREALQGYRTAYSSLVACSQFGDQIYQNAAGAFAAIAQGQPPDPVKGVLLSINDSGLWAVQKNLSNPLWATAVSTPAVLATASFASTTVNIQNTGTEPATFEAFAFYRPAGAPGQTAANAMNLVMGQKVLGKGESGSLELVYYDGHSGVIPSIDQPVQISVVGWNSSGAYFVGAGSSGFQWQPLLPGGPQLSAHRATASAGGQGQTNVVLISNPVRTFIAPDAPSQSYQALIEAVNPFLLPLIMTLSQPIPAGVTMLGTDGVANNGAIVWTSAIQPRKTMTGQFTFSLSATPGASTNLPAATVAFAEPGTTNNLGLASTAAAFAAVLPIQVSASIPEGSPGTNTVMPVTLTNLTASGQSGFLALTLTNSTIAVGTNLALPFALKGAAVTNLALTIPGNLPPGQYNATGLLSVAGGNAQVLRGVYTIPPWKVSLGVAAPVWTTNGLNLSVQGPVGSNYLIQTSSDLINWLPIQYFATTNSPFYFYDSTAINSGTRYYRAVMP